MTNRRKAVAELNRSIAEGVTTRPDICSKCGKKAKVDGHHPDYAKYYDVIWLCRPCHFALHRAMESPMPGGYYRTNVALKQEIRRAERLGVSKYRIAKELGVCEQTITSWISGKTSPSIDKAFTLSAIMQVPVDVLFASSNNVKPSLMVI